MEVLRSPWYKALFRLQDTFAKATVEFFSQQGLSYFPSPLTTGSISSPMGLGSDSLPVRVQLGGTDVYLADSMQFLLEYACRLADKGAFYLMPSFRGEPTNERHLAQFFHSEAEIRGSLDDAMRLAEHYIAHLSLRLLESCREEILEMAGTTSHLEKMAHGQAIPRISFREAMALLEETPGAIEVLPGGLRTISSQGESALMERFGGCVWVTHFDARVVPFYQASDDGYARNADLLMGIGETVGAGERHACASDVRSALAEHRVEPDEYAWYVRMKEQFPLQTAGFGMGMERFMLWALRHDDIRDCQIVARMDGAAMEP